MYNLEESRRALVDADVYAQMSPAEKEIMSLNVGATTPLDGSHEAALHDFRENTQLGNLLEGGEASDQVYYRNISRMGDQRDAVKARFLADYIAN
tara:strand:+ start:4012 stop:4296 length:285 start_codon:yes stop_codon:yes gene_type:complete